MNNGFDIFRISQTLGHASVAMTQKYLCWQLDDDADMVEALVRKTPELRNNQGMGEITQPSLSLITPGVVH